MPTLSTTLILQDTLKAYRTLFPMLGAMGTQFDKTPLTLNEVVTAHIRTLPTAANFDETTGYANGASSGRSLLVDIPITVDKHRHVPIKWAHLDAIKDQKASYEGAVSDAAFVLGREMVLSALNKVNAGTITGELIEATANCDLETLEQITTAMNIAGAAPGGRVGIVSSAVAGALALDTRIASRDYYGILTSGQAYRVFRNVGGFQAIYEFPDMPENNAAGQTFTAADTDIITAAAHGFKNGQKVRVTTTAADLPAGLAVDTTYYVRDVTADTFKVSASVGGAAVNITDAGTGTHTVVGWEKLTGFFFEQSAVAIRAGLPKQTAEYAAALGIPQTMAMESLSDPDSGFALALMKWQQPGTADLFISPTAIWGSSVGKQNGASGTITDKGGYRLVSA
jgi:hypothetical protein